MKEMLAFRLRRAVHDAPRRPTGIGFFADYEDEWMVAFSEVPTFIKLIGFDTDGEIEFDEEGRPMFIGTGTWYFASGSRATVGVGLGKVSNDPVFTSTSVAEATWTRLTDASPLSAATIADGSLDLRRLTRDALIDALERAGD